MKQYQLCGEKDTLGGWIDVVWLICFTCEYRFEARVREMIATKNGFEIVRYPYLEWEIRWEMPE